MGLAESGRACPSVDWLALLPFRDQTVYVIADNNIEAAVLAKRRGADVVLVTENEDQAENLTPSGSLKVQILDNLAASDRLDPDVCIVADDLTDIVTSSKSSENVLSLLSATLKSGGLCAFPFPRKWPELALAVRSGESLVNKLSSYEKVEDSLLSRLPPDTKINEYSVLPSIAHPSLIASVDDDVLYQQLTRLDLSWSQQIGLKCCSILKEFGALSALVPHRVLVIQND